MASIPNSHKALAVQNWIAFAVLKPRTLLEWHPTYSVICSRADLISSSGLTSNALASAKITLSDG